MFNEKASIEKGKLLHNKVLRYLVPALREYGSEFLNKFVKLSSSWSGFTIGIDGQLFDNKLACFCIDTHTENFNEFLDFIQEQDYLCEHRYYDITKDIYLFVIEFPFKEAFKLFLEGKYSKMYTNEQINKYFVIRNNGKVTPIYSVLTKNPNYEREFLRRIQRDFDTDVIPEGEFEYDYPPFINQEVI